MPKPPKKYLRKQPDPPKLPSKTGAPLQYDPSLCKVAAAICSLGGTDTNIADALGVRVSTVKLWRVTFQEFSDACAREKAVADDMVEKSLFQRAIGYDYEEEELVKFEGSVTERAIVRRHVPPDTKAALAWLSVRRPKEWREAMQAGRSGVAIAIFLSKEDTEA